MGETVERLGDIVAIEQNKAIVCRFVEEVWSKGNLVAADELVARDRVGGFPISLLRGLKWPPAGVKSGGSQLPTL